jgi:hypothetical protein
MAGAIYDSHRELQIRRVKVTALPDCLTDLLIDPRIIKLGHFLSADDGRLFSTFNVSLAGRVEVLHLYEERRLDSRYRLPALPDNKLATLAKVVIDLDLAKIDSVRCGRWDSRNRSESMTTYAIGDGKALGRKLDASSRAGDIVRIQPAGLPRPCAYGRLLRAGSVATGEKVELVSQRGPLIASRNSNLRDGQW